MTLILGISGATGAHAARLLLAKAPWPVTVVVSKWGRDVCEREGVCLQELERNAAAFYDDTDLAAAISSGSTPSRGMVILPCAADMLAKIAAGIADTLITRAAHCTLKEGRRLVLCVRESPWTLIDIDNAQRAARAGAMIMPLSPPFYMLANRHPDTVTMTEVLELYAERVLSLFDVAPTQSWEDLA